MLILTRKLQEGLTLRCAGGEEIKILISKVEGKRVRLGITAGKDVQIFRDELLEKTEAIKRAGDIVASALPPSYAGEEGTTEEAVETAVASGQQIAVSEVSDGDLATT